MVLFNPFLKGLVGAIFAFGALWSLGVLMIRDIPGALFLLKALAIILVLGAVGCWLLHDAYMEYKRTGKLWYW